MTDLRMPHAEEVCRRHYDLLDLYCATNDCPLNDICQRFREEDKKKWDEEMEEAATAILARR